MGQGRLGEQRQPSVESGTVEKGPTGPLQPLVSSMAPSAAVQSTSTQTSALVQRQGSLGRKSSALFPNLHKVPDPPPHGRLILFGLSREWP